jgi:hypothetical protein
MADTTLPNPPKALLSPPGEGKQSTKVSSGCDVANKVVILLTIESSL